MSRFVPPQDIRFAEQLFTSEFPEAIRRELTLEEVPPNQSLGELEALAAREEDPIHLAPVAGGALVSYLNKANEGRQARVASVYWEVSRAALRGTLVRIRTALSELVSMSPAEQEVPDREAVRFVVTGDRNVINYSPQRAARTALLSARRRNRRRRTARGRACANAVYWLPPPPWWRPWCRFFTICGSNVLSWPRGRPIPTTPAASEITVSIECRFAHSSTPGQAPPGASRARDARRPAGWR
ncbi:hypothetical protein OG371_26830 [Amycolatopsis sp. NBC_01480]|nr:hypothetical protein [Amycolatopsis sp. NBC_01480]